MTLADSNLSDILARHRAEWRRRAWLELACAVAAALVAGAIAGGWLVTLLRN